MNKFFQLTRTKNGLLGSNLNLFLDGVLFGTITNGNFEKATELNGKKYIVKRDKTFLSDIKKHILLDPDNNQHICEIQHHIYDNIVVAVFPANKSYEFTYETGNPAQTNGLVAQLYPERLEVRENKNIEALIICYFYSRYIFDSN